jgi:hypothetical protein
MAVVIKYLRADGTVESEKSWQPEVAEASLPLTLVIQRDAIPLRGSVVVENSESKRVDLQLSSGAGNAELLGSVAAGDTGTFSPTW